MKSAHPYCRMGPDVGRAQRTKNAILDRKEECRDKIRPYFPPIFLKMTFTSDSSKVRVLAPKVHFTFKACYGPHRQGQDTSSLGIVEWLTWTAFGK
jgi:hypothetical protein